MNTKVNVKSTGLKTRESMKISELDFIKKQDLRKLGSYGEMTIKEFVNFIESLTSKGGYVKKLFQEIYDGLYDNLTDFPELIEEDVMEVHKTYPMTVETNTGLFLNINTALQEMASVLKSRVENNRCASRYSYPSFGSETFPIRRVASIFYHIYLQNKTEKEVSSIMGIGVARVQNIHCKTLTSLLNGDTIFDDIKFNDELLDWINTFKTESLYQSLSYMGITNGIVPEKILNVLGFDVVDFSQFNHKEKLGEILPEQGIIVKRGQKSKYSQVLRALISELRNVIIPMSKEELINKIDKTATISNMSDKYDNEFVERVLSMSEIVVCEDELYYLRREFLSTDVQRVARIIYENYPIDTVSVQEKFEEIYGCPVKILHHWFKDYSFIVHRNRQWTIKGKELLPIKDYIAQYVETKKVFFLNELKDALSKEGYNVPESLRIYVLEICVSDKNDKNHFCHKKHTLEFPEYNWRKKKTSVISVPFSSIDIEPKELDKQSKTSDTISKETVSSGDESQIFYNSITWKNIEDRMKRELNFYKSWMNHEGLDFDTAIESFIHFIQNAKNKNLSIDLPFLLYKYWFTPLDALDRKLYVNNLATGFEGLLSEIKLHNTGDGESYKNSLKKHIFDFPYLAIASNKDYEFTKGFERVVHNIVRSRNEHSHGKYSEMNFVESALSFSQFLALYTFTVAKYAA